MINWQRLRDTTGVSILLDVGTELGISQQALLASTRIDPSELENPLANISVWQEMTLIRNIQAFRASDEQLGLMVSKHCTAAAMGMFGQALATSDTLKQAWQLMQSYGMLGLAFSRFEFGAHGDALSMILHDVEVPADCQRFCEERGLGGCLTLFSDLLNQPLKAKSVDMRLPAPTEPDLYHEFFGVEVAFEAPHTKIVFDRSIENRPLPKANRKLQLASIRYCDEVIESQTQVLTVADRVRAVLENQNLSADLETVAAEFGIGSRQLRRQLTEESTSFREIQLDLKFDRAKALLESGLSVNDVALALDYTSQASFSRAFKKHTGYSPSEQPKQPGYNS